MRDAVDRFVLALLLIAAVALAVIATPARARTIACGARTSIVAQLEHKYGETRRALGLQQGRGLIEVYASDRTGTWTILMTDTAGGPGCGHYSADASRSSRSLSAKSRMASRSSG